MPKVCPQCQAVNGGFAARCRCGFDLSNIETTALLGAAPAAPAAPGMPAARRDWARFFLLVGRFVALLGCAGSALGVPFLVLLSPQGADPGPGRGLVLLVVVLASAVGLCYWAAMFVVFTEVLRLRAERAGAQSPVPSPGPLPQGQQPRHAPQG